jgi:hypothetical protein
MNACRTEPPPTLPPAADPVSALRHPVMDLLADGVPLRLLVDLANPRGLTRVGGEAGG